MVGKRSSLTAALMRSGTSRGLFIRASDLPEDREKWADILCSCMGSPDPLKKQLDGLGGGTSTTSKVAVVGPSKRPDADVDYTFVQVPVSGEKKVDFTGNCGNMSAGVGPFAVEEQLLKPKAQTGMVTVTVHNTNTGVLIKSSFEIENGLPIEYGDFNIPGLSQTGSPICLDFLNPGGSMTGALLPTGNPTDIISLTGFEKTDTVLGSVKAFAQNSITVSMVDAANPFVFVLASDLGLTGAEPIDELAKYAPILMHIRCAASVAMGLAKNSQEAALVGGTPKIALVGPSQNSESEDIQVRPFSMGLPHPSLQITGAVCLAAACSVPGCIPNDLVLANRNNDKQDVRKPYRFAHASGIVVTESDIALRKVTKDEKRVIVKSASVYRTARRLFQGTAYYISDGTEDPKVSGIGQTAHANGKSDGIHIKSPQNFASGCVRSADPVTA